jgi:hypothetical protein
MNLSTHARRHVLSWALLVVAAPNASGQKSAETFTGTASVETAGRAAAHAPVVLIVERQLSQSEADRLAAAFKKEGADGLRQALVGLAPTGSVQLGGGKPVPTRITIERPTDKGRLLTIVTDQPILFVGAGFPDAKPKEGYDFAVIDIEVDASGSGSGTLAPAASITWNETAFVVRDYGSELVRLTSVRKTK